jgi:capsule biosynthesis phosphatase
MIEYIIEKIPSSRIFIIYNIALAQYNFEQIIINSNKNKSFHFAQVEYLTRGAVETALVGINKFIEISNSNFNPNEPIAFIDNDNIHTITDCSLFQGNFIGYSKNYDRTNYSFITIINYSINNDLVLDSRITAIEEKVKISDDYCCGIYGVKNLETFLTYAKKLIECNNKTKNEFYFSQMYKLMILEGEIIRPVFLPESKHVGTLEEIKNCIPELGENKSKLRICFDRDNTLVSYPCIPNDYSTVKPIQKNIDLLNYLKKQGHEIIIHTARRMKTHNYNIGKVIKDIARITLDTLETLQIEYDEIIFGKPIADIYIDDRAINPYINNISYFGIFNDSQEFIHNKLNNNKYNSIKRIDNNIIKSGPYSYMKGELYFYQSIPDELNYMFPKMIDYNKIDNKMDITLEYINGIPLYFLYKNQLITEKHIDSLIDILDKLHNYNYPITITTEAIKNNYFKKLASRFNRNDYYFENAEEVYSKIISRLNSSYNPNICGVIHGDFWFSNILLDYNDNVKCIDMKGQVDGVLTLNGDKYYDYGKLYQSILGYDLILNNVQINNGCKEYIEKIKKYYLDKCMQKGLDIEYLEATTHSLILGVFHSINSNEDKARIWNFLCKIIMH